MFDVLVCLNRTIRNCLGVSRQELKIINFENLILSVKLEIYHLFELLE